MKKISETLLEIMEEALPGFTKLVEEKVAREEAAKALTFGELGIGDWFTFRGWPYVKTYDHSWFNSVAQDGTTHAFNHETVVQLIPNPFDE